MKVDLVVANTIFVCVTAPENEDVGEIRVLGISDRPARFWEVLLAFMYTNQPEEPWGLIFGARC